jgi:glycosyltransferase involved in cell wall biosynthesis
MKRLLLILTIGSLSTLGLAADNCAKQIEDLIGGRIEQVKDFTRPLYLVTDTDMDMTNGVVTVVKKMTEELDNLGIPYKFIDNKIARGFKINNPMAQGAGLYYLRPGKLHKMIQQDRPFAIHLVTEGTIGRGARKYALQNKMPFSTFYHTAFHLYAKDMFNIPVGIGEAYLGNFHKKADTVMAATETMLKQLEDMGVPREKLKIRSHGVDLERFRPRTDAEILPEVHKLFEEHPKPHSLFVGRVGIEKNIQAFLDAEQEGTKFIVGDGPLLETFRQQQKNGQHQNVVFLGRKGGDELAHIYNKADVFVFPSHTDTFGLVQLEAMASGTPVAAFPVPGPIDVVTRESGALNENLSIAIREALSKDPKEVRAYAEQYSWRDTALQFLQLIHEIPEETIKKAKTRRILRKIIPVAALTGGGFLAVSYFYIDRQE